MHSCITTKHFIKVRDEIQHPDIAIAYETWLKSDVHDYEVIPTDPESEIFLKDQKDGYEWV